MIKLIDKVSNMPINIESIKTVTVFHFCCKKQFKAKVIDAFSGLIEMTYCGCKGKTKREISVGGLAIKVDYEKT